MCTYLNKVGSTYYFRRAVPLELRPFIRTKPGAPRSEWKRSLGTKDREAAKRLLSWHTIDTDAEIDTALAARAGNDAQISPAQPVQRQTRAIETWAATRDENAQAGAEIAAEAIDAKDQRREELADFTAFLERRLKGSTAEMPRHLRAFKYLIEDREFDRVLLRDQLRATRAELSAAKALSTSEIARVPAIQPPPSQGTDLLKIVELWAAERKVQQKTKDAHTAVVRWFHERTSTKPVAGITKRDVLDFKDKLIAEGTTLANTKVKLSRLKSLLAWAADNDHAVDNVAAGVTVRDTDAAKNKRREFDLHALNLILGTAIYEKGARPVSGRGQAAYWLPLLALYTGARLEELGQLRPSDVQQITYPDAEGEGRQSWFLRLKEDTEDNLRLKNAASERDVPMHPELIRLGFLDYLQSAKGEARLFPALKADKYGRLTAKWGEWFGAQIRVLGIADKRMVFHSFRHTFKQYARHAGIDEGVQRAIMGHSSGDVADQYGSGVPAHIVVAGMARFRVPGLRDIKPWTAT